MTVRWVVVTDDGRSTRPARPEEEEPIRAFLRAFIEETKTEPLGVHDVEGLETSVWFQKIFN